VLREDRRKKGAFAKFCFYTAANPVRDELVAKSEEWPFTSCIVPGYPKLNPFEKDYWSKFWKIFTKLRQPDAGNIKRPPLRQMSNNPKDAGSLLRHLPSNEGEKLETPHVVTYRSRG
jgi:hypothetical protein